jgi:hypothetical protein
VVLIYELVIVFMKYTRFPQPPVSSRRAPAHLAA